MHGKIGLPIESLESPCDIVVGLVVMGSSYRLIFMSKRHNVVSEIAPL